MSHADMEGVTGEAAPVVERKTPSDFLRHVIGRPVIVKLVNGALYQGNLL